MLARALVVSLAKALALEPEGLVQSKRGLVPGEDVELELRSPDSRAHTTACVEEHRPDAPPAMALGDHQAEVGDVPARRMRIARERQPADDRSVLLGDEHRGVGMR